MKVKAAVERNNVDGLLVEDLRQGQFQMTPNQKSKDS